MMGIDRVYSDNTAHTALPQKHSNAQYSQNSRNKNTQFAKILLSLFTIIQSILQVQALKKKL